MFLSKLLTPPTPAATTPTRAAIETRHIPYVETLWNRLQDARAQVAAKETYLSDANALGLQIASVATLTADTKRDVQAVARAADEIERIKAALAFGAEPTTPPRDWYCGRLTDPRGNDREDFPSETWPNREDSRARNVFASAMPMAALRRYAATKHLLDDVRVYSPRYEHFTRHPNPHMTDPVLIGMIRFLREPQYVELARWDIGDDLAVIFGAVGR